MIKEVKLFFYLLIIFFFTFFIIRYYISEKNIKKTNMTILNIEDAVKLKQENLIFLKNNTENIIEFVEIESKEKNKTYFFWKLLN